AEFSVCGGATPEPCGSASCSGVIETVAPGADCARRKFAAPLGLTKSPPLVPAQTAPLSSTSAYTERPCNSATSAQVSAPVVASLAVSLNSPRLVPHQVALSDA